MKDNVEQLLYEATLAKRRLVHGDINYDEAVVIINRYVDYFNKVSTEKAKQFKRKPYTITAQGFLR